MLVDPVSLHSYVGPLEKLHSVLSCSVAVVLDQIRHLLQVECHLKAKMRELGALGNSQYKLACMLKHDREAMLAVKTDKYGVFDCNHCSSSGLSLKFTTLTAQSCWMF